MKTRKGTKKALAFLALMLAVGMLLTLAGCSGNTAGSGAPTAGTSAADTPATDTPPADGDRDEILIGYVAPLTGPLSVFTVATKWVEEQLLPIMNAEGGVYIKQYDKNLPIRIIYGDCESDSTKASEVADKLVMSDGVDLLIGAWTPSVALPVSAVGERRKVPVLISNSPVNMWLEGGPYEWATGILFDYQMTLEDYITTWDKVDTNKRVGLVLDTTVDGISTAELLSEMLPPAGYEIVDPGRFPEDTNDYTNIISQLSQADVDILSVNMITPNFAVFWKQLKQFGWVPKVLTCGRAIQFTSDIVALGDAAGLTTEVHWDRTFPFASSVTGQSCEEIAEAWETDHPDVQVPSTLGYDYSCLETAYDALKRCETLEPADILAAILATDLDTPFGKVTFDDRNASIMPCVTAQWVEDDKWGYTMKVVASDTYPLIPAVDPIVMPGSE